MYRIGVILEELSQTVGFTEGVIFNKLPEDLKVTSYGRSLEKEHPMLTQNNLKRISPKTEMHVSNFDASKTYNAGEFFIYNDITYKVKPEVTDVSGVTPPNESYYEIYNPEIEYLRELRNMSIKRVVDNFIETKISQKTSEGILSTGYTAITTPEKYDKGTNKFIGLHYSRSSVYLAIHIKQIGINLTTAADFDLYIYSTQTEEFVRKITINHTGTGLEYFEVDYLIAGGFNNHIIGVFSDELPEEPGLMQHFQNLNKALCIPVTGDYTDKNERPLDLAYSNSTILTSHYTVYCDLTNFITANKKHFTEAIIAQFVYNFVYELFYNPEQRINQTTRVNETDKISYDLENMVLPRLKDAMKSLNVSTSDIDAVCLKSGKQIRYKTIS